MHQLTLRNPKLIGSLLDSQLYHRRRTKHLPPQTLRIDQRWRARHRLWKRFLPNRPFSYRLHEQDFEYTYWSEFQFAATTRIFCGLAILLACLGLYGLAAFTAERRTKEIGIRKVLGASMGGLLGLIAREFAKLVLVANVIAWPLAYLYLNDWLNGYVQRIDLTVLPFLAGGAVVLVVSMVTISLRTYSAARTDPVKAIRIE